MLNTSIIMRLRTLALLISMTSPALAYAREAPPVAVVQKEDIRLLGRLNVNLATREQLLEIPGLDGLKVDALLDARTRGPLSSLSAFTLSDESLARLSTEGPSTLRKIRPLPLEVFITASASATR